MNNPILKRKPEESDFEYKVRICIAKLNKEIDLEWQDIVELLNLDCHRDSLRKMAYGYKEMFEDMQNKKISSIESDEVLNELELKKIELLEERKKLQTIRTEYNKIAREKSRRDLLFEHIKEGFQKLDVPDVDVSLGYDSTEKTFILTFGDIHFGKIFKSVNNEYSEEIAMQRMNKLLEETIKLLDLHDVTTLHIINGADNVEGLTLRVSQMKSLQSGFVDQVIKFSKFYAKWVNELSKYVRIELHHLTSSNHTELRPFSSNRGEFPAEDMERIIGMYIQDVLEHNEKVKVHLYESGFADFELVGFNIGALHGHQLKNTKKAISELSQLHRKFYDILFVSHFHHGNALTVGEGNSGNIEIIQVPSLMGSDEYSDSLFTGAKAGASFHVVERGKGRTVQHNIILN